MPVRNASAIWEGNLQEGKGSFKTGTGSFEGIFSFSTRMEDNPGTNPEELIGAAHAGCFSMAFSGRLGRAGFTPARISTSAKVTFTKGDDGWAIRTIELTTEAVVPGIDEAAFQEAAQGAKENCPVSKALTGVEIILNAKLVK
jgi:osmotically inducible protein OsmC